MVIDDFWWLLMIVSWLLDDFWYCWSCLMIFDDCWWWLMMFDDVWWWIIRTTCDAFTEIRREGEACSLLDCQLNRGGAVWIFPCICWTCAGNGPDLMSPTARRSGAALLLRRFVQHSKVPCVPWARSAARSGRWWYAPTNAERMCAETLVKQLTRGEHPKISRMGAFRLWFFMNN